MSLRRSAVPRWRQPRSRVYEVGTFAGMYESIHDAIEAVNLNPPSVNDRATIMVYPGRYVSTTAYQVPGNTRIQGFGDTTQLINDSTTLFNLTADRVYLNDFLIEGSTNAALYAITCNGKSGVILKGVNMLGMGGTARQKFLHQTGASWSVLSIRDCVVDYRGLSGYAVTLQNSGVIRYVDTWIQNCFFDAFGLTTFGGSFQTIGLQDCRFWYNVIRGTNAPGSASFYNTGVRVNNGGLTGINVEFAHCTMSGPLAGSGGLAAYGEANTTYSLYNCLARGAASAGTLVNQNSYVVQ